MTIETILSPKLYDCRQTPDGHTAVAVDILRATSAICAAFCAGAAEIVPLSSLDPLPQYAAQGYSIAAERNGTKLYGATLGNSPTEYLSLDLCGQRIAYSTTNGTVSITTAVSAASNLYVGAFSNISALANKLVGCENILILCSGWKGDPSLEDTLFAGALIHKLQTAAPNVSLLNDASAMALQLWLSANGNPQDFCANATHVARLQRLGCQQDIDWSFQMDTISLTPHYRSSTQSLIV